MRALQVVAPGEARVVDVPEPKGIDSEVLLQVRMVGMCGSDLNTFRGNNPMVSYPRILGHEIAATIVEGPHQGRNVTVSPYTNCGRCASCRRNRPNACEFNQTFGVQRDGALAEYITVSREKIYEAGDLSLQELALVEPLTIGFHAAARGRVDPTDIVAVFGCGGVGLGAISGAARRGATVIAIDVDDEKLAIASSAGARHLLNSKRDDLHGSLREWSSGRGPDVVIEAIGVPDTFRAAVEEVAFTGRVVYIGYAKAQVSYETRLFVQKEIDILGSRNALPEDFRAVIQMLQAKQFPVAQTITRVVPLAEAASARQAWSQDPARFSKILIDVG